MVSRIVETRVRLLMLDVTRKPHHLPKSLAEWAEMEESCHQHLDTGWMWRAPGERRSRRALWVSPLGVPRWRWESAGTQAQWLGGPKAGTVDPKE